jgi:hypothetical protein
MALPLAKFAIRKEDTKQTVEVEVIDHKTLDIDTRFVTICMIGQSRNGKSSFLNCLTSVIMKRNISCFKSLSVKESKACDVTKGMQFYQFMDGHPKEKTHYLIVDAQGLAGTQSEVDPALLMYCYFISDIIVVNCGKTLDTSVLKMLEPISALRTKISTTNPTKPSLMFRLMDVDDYDNETAKQCFDVMMTDREDQVHGVRLCLRELFLFDEIPVIYTERPDKNDIRLLDTGNITKFLERNASFTNACKKIHNRIMMSNCVRGNIQKFLIDQAKIVNENKDHINAGTFDATSRITQDDILEWIHGTTFAKNGAIAVKSNVPDELKTPIGITTCHTSDYEKVLEREKKINECIDKFKERFDYAPSDIYEQGYAALENIIKPPLNTALEICTKSSWKEFHTCLTSANHLLTAKFDLVVFNEIEEEENYEEKSLEDLVALVDKLINFDEKTFETQCVDERLGKLMNHISQKIESTQCHKKYKILITMRYLTDIIENIRDQLLIMRQLEAKEWAYDIDNFKETYNKYINGPFELLKERIHELDKSFEKIYVALEFDLMKKHNMIPSDSDMIKELNVNLYSIEICVDEQGICSPKLVRHHSQHKYYKSSTLAKAFSFDYDDYIARLHNKLLEQENNFNMYREKHFDELIPLLTEERKIPRVTNYADMNQWYDKIVELADKIQSNGFTTYVMPKYACVKTMDLLCSYVDVFRIRSKQELMRVTSLEVRTLLKHYYNVAEKENPYYDVIIKNKHNTRHVNHIELSNTILEKVYQRWTDDILLGHIGL